MSMGPRAAQSPWGAISGGGCAHAAGDGASSHVTRAGWGVRAGSRHHGTYSEGPRVQAEGFRLGH